MRIRWLLALALLVSADNVRAQETGHRDRIQAATDNALQSLRQQVDDVRLQRELTVGDLIGRVGGVEDLDQALARAQQIGGPRWLDENTCQVRLEISGETVGAALKQIVSRNPKKSPLGQEALAARLESFEQKTFCAVGTSTASQSLAGVRPLEPDGWATVGDDARAQAIAAARQDAITRAMQSVQPVPISKGKTVGDALAVKSVHDAVEQWLQNRPVTRIEFQPDYLVKLTLAAPADELFTTFQTAAKAQKNVPVPADDSGWDEIRQRFSARLLRVTGRAAATPPAHVVNAVALPATPPDWIGKQIDAEGFSKPKNSRLKAARAAEADALTRLRSQVEALPLTSGLSIAEAQKRDPRLAEAVGHAVNQARTYKVDYESDGSVKVRLNLDLRDVWDEIQTVP